MIEMKPLTGIRRQVGSLLIALLAVAALPTAALACPVCFTASDAPIVNGVGMAILALLGVTVFVLASFAAFFINLMRRARHAGAAVQAPSMARPAEHGGHS